MNVTTCRMVLVRGTATLCLGLTGCVAGVGYDGPGPGYDTDVRLGYGVGYYEPYGYAVGGWGGGYRVGPGRGGERRGDGGGHPYRSAPESRPTPSIPRGSRGASGDRRR